MVLRMQGGEYRTRKIEAGRKNKEGADSVLPLNPIFYLLTPAFYSPETLIIFAAS
jgi:hypothetical protein